MGGVKPERSEAIQSFIMRVARDWGGCRRIYHITWSSFGKEDIGSVKGKGFRTVGAKEMRGSKQENFLISFRIWNLLNDETRIKVQTLSDTFLYCVYPPGMLSS